MTLKPFYTPDLDKPSQQRGPELVAQLNPNMEEVLDARYGHLLPGMAQTVTQVAYGEFYGRAGLDMKSRYTATIAALTVQGGQTAPQLKINIAAARTVGMSQTEIAEVIWQMALYGGLPATINALNSALEVFSQE
ncbi:MAG: carboxymuconolactone decarboxylase family protein [Sulfitobacter sp.]